MDVLRSLVLILIVLAYFPLLIVLPYVFVFNARIVFGRVRKTAKEIVIFVAKVVFLLIAIVPLLSWIMLFSLIRYRDGRIIRDIRSMNEPESIDIEHSESLIPVGLIVGREDNHRYQWNGKEWEDLGEVPPIHPSA